jgi:hypothetical protein
MIVPVYLCFYVGILPWRGSRRRLSSEEGESKLGYCGCYQRVPWAVPAIVQLVGSFGGGGKMGVAESLPSLIVT